MLKVCRCVCVRSLEDYPLPIKPLKGKEPAESIDLSGKRLGNASAVVIAGLISTNTVTKSINLLNNELDEQGANSIVEAATGNPQLTTLCGLCFNPLPPTDPLVAQPESDFSVDMHAQGLGVGDAILLAFSLKNSVLVDLKCAPEPSCTKCQRPP